jgi:DNA-binding MarR family transcriptional regulator
MAQTKKSATKRAADKKPRATAVEPVVPSIDPSRLPLFSLLSFVLVAFTIEFDNEAERRIPHYTTASQRPGDTRERVWLTSLAMYLNCMKWVPEEGIRVRELVDRARTEPNLPGMLRWGYITIASDPADTRKRIPEADKDIHATRLGKTAQTVWTSLFAEIEHRWEARFGQQEIDELRDALRAVAQQIDANLPECMPILQYGLVTDGPAKPRANGRPTPVNELPLASILSRALVAFALEFEGRSHGSLAIGANVLRVLSEHPIPLRDIPIVSGVSKESVAMAIGILKKHGVAVEAPDPSAARGKVINLTQKGIDLRERAAKFVVTLEHEWRDKFGASAIDRLRAALETIIRAEGTEPDANGNASLLFAGIRPTPQNWRAAHKPPKTLPHFPMVLHRGGFPDGS